ncbi:MAG: tetratricopeptide repeat protein [Burkholderiales bacterium]|nr:tetratricopeptide repeat protein [Burkholderiales bacterium]
MFCVHLFGSPALETTTGREPLPAARPYQLLAYLACRGTWVSRDALATIFWPERDTSTARGNLRFVLVQIRRLGHVAKLEAQAGSLRWLVDSDVHRFERAIAEGRWSDAIDLYQGQLLDGFELPAPAPFCDWLQFERARLHALWHDAVSVQLAQLLLDPPACAALASRALRTDPFDETTLSYRLRALARLGRQEDLRRAYRDYAQHLAGELGIEPSAALRDLVRELDVKHAGGPVAATGAGVVNAASQAVVGRRAELRRIRQLMLDADCRWLTITGPGGVGKSSLAQAAMPQLASEFADGVNWIALNDIQTVEQVASSCAVTLGLELRGTNSPRQQVADHLRDAQALLVFDNAEHLTGLGPWLGTLLGNCRRLKILVTSRARLETADEWLLPLDGLPAPEPDETEVDALCAFDAVHLFDLRARRVHPDFDLRAHAAEVAALVRAVEGLPLAIELAAVWVRLLPVAEIRRELVRSLDLLDRADASQVRGHRMRDSLEHSWCMLGPTEQRTLMRLAVFQGDFSREAALVVAEAALPLLAALADRSLLRTTEQGRFVFHPLVQQFALEKLTQAGADEELAVRTRHAEHFVMLLARYNEFDAVDQRSALQQIGIEFKNVLAAWRWAIESRRVDLLQRCAAAMEGFLDARGQQEAGLEEFDRARTAIDESRAEHQAARCQIELGCAAFCFRRGEFREGERAARAALQAAQRARYRFGIKTSTNTLGLMLWRLGKMKEAAFCLRDVLRRARVDGEQAEVPLYAGNLAAVERELGNYDESARLLEEALAGHRRLGHHAGIHSALSELANLQLDRGRPAAAVTLALEGLGLAERSGFRRNVPYFHRILADACFELGDLGRAREHAQQALDAIGSGGDRAVEPACRLRMSYIDMRSGPRASALSGLQAAAHLAIEMQSPRIKIAVLLAYARYCLLVARPDRARTMFAVAARHPSATRRQRELAEAEFAACATATSDGGPTWGDAPASSLDEDLDLLLSDIA